jgi:hypothetical protein
MTPTPFSDEALSQAIEQIGKDAARWRFLESEAYECVVPHGNKVDGSRTAWITKLHAGKTFAEAIDAAITAREATSGERDL